MKYNSIGEQLIAKAKELDPNYKPDKFNDMSEAIDILLNNNGGVLLDIGPYINGGEITQEGYNLIEEKINSGEVIGIYISLMSMPFILYSYLIDENGVIGFTFNSPLAGGELARITIKKDLSFGLEQIVDGSSGSSKVWYELPNLLLLENITQEQFNEIKNLALQNQLAGINCGGLYCPLIFYQDGQNIAFFYPWYENDIFMPHLIRLDTDLSVKKIPYSTITLPQTTPSSQVIPSITTSNTQQNLTIGNGLEIKNGALQEKVLNVSITDILTDATKIQTIFTAMQSTPTSKTHAGVLLNNDIPFSAFQDCDKIVLDLSGLSALGLNVGGELIFIKGFNTDNYGKSFYLNYMTGGAGNFSIATVVLASSESGNGLSRLVVEHSGTN